MAVLVLPIGDSPDNSLRHTLKFVSRRRLLPDLCMRET